MLTRFLLLSAAVRLSLAAPSSDFTTDSRLATTALGGWYNSSTGLWDSTGWWNSANCMTTIGNLAAIEPRVNHDVFQVFENTLKQAPQYNEGAMKVVMPDFMIQTVHKGISSRPRHNPNGFINGFYDDEGWWALSWIQAYDITGRHEYLSAAVDIFNDMKKASTTPCGGIWWDRAQSYVNAIANELYLSVAAHLSNRVQGRERREYRQIAEDQWSWFQKSGMINADSTVNDGLTSTCRNNNGTIWSYNQAVVIGGLVELSKGSSDESYLQGVLHDPCEPHCGDDGSQFKGVFMRNLKMLQETAPDNNYLAFITTNARSIWNNNRNEDNQLGINWAGPFMPPATAGTHSSAMDALGHATEEWTKPMADGIDRSLTKSKQ
ncbi:glycosyl hydrolase [Blumeria hordei DH14]|uniref:Glycosyl hydrolase n=1 Tax=Blumeria graminis f. sp. hordei (strain DH14) TaxID=546991 RepID=N1JE03_BLUG1|nr:glycosyl hydrolase [Blumeria hordei DH14]